MGGWGPMFGTKSKKKTFFLTPSLIYIVNHLCPRTSGGERSGAGGGGGHLLRQVPG